jgi:hypothetical protein
VIAQYAHPGRILIARRRLRFRLLGGCSRLHKLTPGRLLMNIDTGGKHHTVSARSELQPKNAVMQGEW